MPGNSKRSVSAGLFSDIFPDCRMNLVPVQVEHAHGDGARRPVQGDDKRNRPRIVPGVGEHSRMTRAEPSRNWTRYCMLGVELRPATFRMPTITLHQTAELI